MPTKKKRVGFIPRGDVMKIIYKLSIENNLSISKIVSILVEEALSVRGIFNKKNGKGIPFNQKNKDGTKYLSDESLDLNDNENFIINTKLINDINPGKTNFLKQTSQEEFDLQTYKKFLSFLKFQEMMDKYNA